MTRISIPNYYLQDDSNVPSDTIRLDFFIALENTGNERIEGLLPYLLRCKLDNWSDSSQQYTMLIDYTLWRTKNKVVPQDIKSLDELDRIDLNDFSEKDQQAINTYIQNFVNKTLREATVKDIQDRLNEEE